ncbi:MAG: hypothetical protein V4590_06385 [Bacteroidota bacterium]
MDNPTQHQPEYLYSTDRLLNIGKGNMQFVKRMLTVFVQQMNETTSRLTTHLHNPDQVYSILHQAKPSISEICNPGLLQRIHTIEKLAKLHYTAEMIEQVQLFIPKIQEVTQAISQHELSES